MTPKSAVDSQVMFNLRNPNAVLSDRRLADLRITDAYQKVFGRPGFVKSPHDVSLAVKKDSDKINPKKAKSELDYIELETEMSLQCQGS